MIVNPTTNKGGFNLGVLTILVYRVSIYDMAGTTNSIIEVGSNMLSIFNKLL